MKNTSSLAGYIGCNYEYNLCYAHLNIQMLLSGVIMSYLMASFHGALWINVFLFTFSAIFDCLFLLLESWFPSRSLIWFLPCSNPGFNLLCKNCVTSICTLKHTSRCLCVCSPFLKIRLPASDVSVEQFQQGLFSLISQLGHHVECDCVSLHYISSLKNNTIINHCLQREMRWKYTHVTTC